MMTDCLSLAAGTAKRAYWRDAVKRYRARYFAVSAAVPHPPPPKVVHLFSAGRMDGTAARYYAFETETEQADFLRAYPHTKPCGNPFPPAEGA